MAETNHIFKPQILSRELQLLLMCMNTKQDEQHMRGLKILLMDIDWELFLNLARHHRVYPLVYIKLKKQLEGSIPDDVIQSLANDYRNNTFQMLHLSGEMESLFKLFDENKIQALMLKGPVLSLDLYGDLSLRTAKDLDILVQQRDIKKTDELLKQFGYERMEEADHHISYLHYKKAINIEIHWRLHPIMFKEPSFYELWERRSVCALTSYPIFSLGMEDLFLFLVTHGARHRWFRLRWLGDIDRLVQKGINWSLLIPQSKDLQYEHMMCQAIILANELLDTPVPIETQSVINGRKPRRLAQLAMFKISERRLSRIRLPWDSYFLNKYYFYSLMPNGALKWSYIKSHFTPHMIDRETLQLPKSMDMLYFFLRPGLWLWRKIRRI
jgi:hypothetical protein